MKVKTLNLQTYHFQHAIIVWMDRQVVETCQIWGQLDGWVDGSKQSTFCYYVWQYLVHIPINPGIYPCIHRSNCPKCEKHVVPLGPCAPSSSGRCCEGKSAMFQRWWSDSENMRRRSAKMRCCKGEWLILLSLLRLRNFALSPAHFHLRFRYWRIIIGF